MKIFVLVIFSALVFLGAARAAGPVKTIEVAVNCTCEDSVGSELCSALKEKIRASRGFELVHENEAKHSSQGFGVSLVSVPADDGDYSSAVAIIFTMPMPRGLAGYVNGMAAIVGARKVDDEASSIMGELDQETESMQ